MGLIVEYRKKNSRKCIELRSVLPKTMQESIVTAQKPWLEHMARDKLTSSEIWGQFQWKNAAKQFMGELRGKEKEDKLLV